MWKYCNITGRRWDGVLLCALLACGTAYGSADLNGVADVNATEAAEEISDANTSPVVLRDANSHFVPDPNLTMGNDVDTGQMLYKLVGAVLIVLLLGGAALYLSRRVLPRISNIQAREVRVLETVHLGQHKALHLVKAGDQRFLLGSTSERITRLATIGDELSEMDFLNKANEEEE